ncbi:hypothetical protein FRB99_006098 [Tulasnella sp. 403]|nr:hypothetical protein FRB99_006098 [Tulasnella sp. 403]
MSIPGAPNPDPPSIQASRRTHYIVEQPVNSQWDELQQPIDSRIGLENEVMELRRRASAAAGETRRLQEERKWAISQGNRAREFQLGLDIKNYQTLSDSLNRKAAEKIAIARGQSLLAQGGDVEVSGLSTKDAIALTDRRLRSAKAAGDGFVRVSLAGNNLRISEHDRSGQKQVRTLLETYLRG